MPLTEKGQEIKSNMEKEYGSKKGEEVFYASKNAGKISGVDECMAGQGGVPVGDCYGRTDQSWPPMDPTSIGAMPTMEQGADAPPEKEGKWGETWNKKGEKVKVWTPSNKTAREASGDEQPTQPSGMQEPTDGGEPAAAGCDPAISFDEAVFGPAAHDYRADGHSPAGNLPETLTHRQMQNFAASLNFGEGVTK